MADAAVLMRHERKQDLGAVQGRQWDEVEDGQDDIDVHDGRHDREDRHPCGGRGSVGYIHEHQAQDSAEDERQEQVRSRTGERDQEFALALVLQIIGIVRHRLGPAEREVREQKCGERHQDGAEGIDMLQGIQGQTAGQACGRVAQAVSHESVRDFMEDDREYEDDERQYCEHDKAMIAYGFNLYGQSLRYN